VHIVLTIEEEIAPSSLDRDAVNVCGDRDGDGQMVCDGVELFGLCL